MAAIVIGASGHLGNAIVRELLGQGRAVTAVARREHPAANLNGLRVRYVSADAENSAALNSLIAGHDLVVDAAAPYPDTLASAAEVERIRRAAAARMDLIIDAVRRHRARLLHISSFATLPDRARGFLRMQRALMRDSHPYFAAKSAMEARVLDAARGGLHAAVINPTLCLGPWDQKLRERCFVARLLAGEAPVSISQVVNVVDVRDVARLAVAATSGARHGEPIAVVGHNLPLHMLCGWLCEMAGVAAPKTIAPAPFSVAAAWWSEAAFGALGRRPPLPALAAILTAMHDARDPSPLQLDLGSAPRPLSATLADTLAWYRSIAYC
jgi:dihydroflavonol-4-reductase